MTLLKRSIRLTTLTVTLLAALGSGQSRVATAQSLRLTVTRFDDPAGAGACPADCSLRQAVAAVATGGAVAIPPGRYSLAGQLLIAQDVTIAGAGARTTSIVQTSSGRVIEVGSGTVVISGVTITGGRTSSGGAEPNAGVGGGIWIDSPASLTVLDSAIVGNHADQSGGGIDVNGRLALVRSTVADNIASGGLGIGGGIDSFGISVTLVNSTIAGNISSREGGGFFTAGTASLTNVTLDGNTAFGGSGLSVSGAPGVSLLNTILNANNGSNCSGAIASLGHNLSSDSSCGLSDPTDVENTDAQLGSLQNNGGQTDTQAPGPTSRAIDAALSSACPSTDQRGIARPQGAGCDIGSVERLGPSTGLLAFSDGCSIVVTPPDGSSSTVVVDGAARIDPTLADNCFTDPGWSSDGRRLAFVGTSSTGSYSLWTMDYPAGEPRMIAAALSEPPGGPNWSPDERTIAFDSGNLNDGWTIQTVPSDGSAPPAVLLSGPKNFRMPAWSRDGGSLAFAWDGPIETGVVGIYSLANGAFSSVAGSAAGEYPRWSPGGDSIAFSADGLIKIANLNTHTVVTISDGSDADVAPAWSPDGSEIAFRVRNSGDDIWTMNADGSQRTLVTWGDYDDSVKLGHRPVDWQPIVGRLATTTTIVSETPDPSLAGQTTTVTVAVAAVTPGSGNPTGLVTLSDGAGSVCAATLAAGTAQCTVTSSTIGSLTLVATYNGDGIFDASTGSHAHQVQAANAPPFIVTPASAAPNPVVGNTTSLSVLGGDDGGEANLTYTWSTDSAAVGFSPNGTNTAKNTVATFGTGGIYTITVTVTDQHNLTTTSTVGVFVAPPVVVDVKEHVSISDSMQSPLSLSELLHIVDKVAVSTTGTGTGSAVVVSVNEHVSIHDAPGPSTSVAEGVHVADRTIVTLRARDRTPPVLNLPDRLVVEAASPLGAIVRYEATALDAVEGPRPVDCVPPSGATFAPGRTVVHCSSADRVGNTAHGTFVVLVRDTTPPTLAAAPDVTVTATVRPFAQVTFRLPAATDAVDPLPIVTATPSSGSLFPVGTTTVTVRARDHSGNTTTEHFTVTVISGRRSE
jgi:hypothetical protein